jgi:hypothetical protein
LNGYRGEEGEDVNELFELYDPLKPDDDYGVAL